MAYVKIEPSGCCEDKGMVQVRLSMFLDPGDYGFEKHHIDVPVRDLTEHEISSVFDEHGRGLKSDYEALVSTIGTKKQVNPFHNHFILVPPDITEKEIMDIAEAFLHEAYLKWATDSKLDLVNDHLPFEKQIHDSKLVDSKVAEIKIIKTERKL